MPQKLISILQIIIQIRTFDRIRCYNHPLFVCRRIYCNGMLCFKITKFSHNIIDDINIIINFRNDDTQHILFVFIWIFNIIIYNIITMFSWTRKYRC